MATTRDGYEYDDIQHLFYFDEETLEIEEVSKEHYRFLPGYNATRAGALRQKIEFLEKEILQRKETIKDLEHQLSMTRADDAQALVNTKSSSKKIEKVGNLRI
jgi:hypothetical protein